MKNNYSPIEFITTMAALVLTKLSYKDARLIRRPFYCRGRRRMKYGKGLTTGYSCRFDLLGNRADNKIKLVIGTNCKMGDYVHIVANDEVIIGDDCLMASKVFISDTNHGEYNGISLESSPDIPPDERPLHMKKVYIGNKVWIGENVCILPGVTIGNGCIVSANSVVTKDIPNNTIVAGIPAVVIKKWDSKNSKWIRV